LYFDFGLKNTLWLKLGILAPRQIRLTCGFMQEFLLSVKRYRPGQKLKTQKMHSKNFAWEMQIFCEWRSKWRTLWPPWPTSPGSGCQPLDGSILLKLSLESRLQSGILIL